MVEGYFIMLDQTKAFDRVNHQYLFKVLDHIGIKGDFFEISITIYKNISSQITVNRGRTEKIAIKRGVRQGCPYSMMLFVISTIPLILMINAENKITGYTTKRNNTIKIQSYADDNTIIIKKTHELNNILQVYEKHTKASEAEINKDKTEIFKIGNQKETTNKAFSEKIKCRVRILGSIFCKNKEDETKLNLEEATNTLKTMKENYGTSLVGKILNINTYIYSQIWNNAYIINTKDKHYKNFIKDIENYLQPTKGDEILEHAERRINEGGLNLINITERIETLKLREIIEADTKLPETDNIVHMIGT